MNRTLLERIDAKVISKMKIYFPFCARFSMFAIFFWFGFLKIIAISPANPLVENLLSHTLPFIGFKEFSIFFGIFEMLIGVAFIAPKMERLAIILLIPHMVTTMLPLILLPEITWSGLLTPTLEGQYIIKNLALISLAMGIVGQLKILKYPPESTPNDQ